MSEIGLFRQNVQREQSLRYGVWDDSFPQYNFCMSGFSRFSSRVSGFRGLFSCTIADLFVRRLRVVSFALNKKVRFDKKINFDVNNNICCCIFNETIADEAVPNTRNTHQHAIRRSSEDCFLKKSKLQFT